MFYLGNGNSFGGVIDKMGMRNVKSSQEIERELEREGTVGYIGVPFSNSKYLGRTFGVDIRQDIGEATDDALRLASSSMGRGAEGICILKLAKVTRAIVSPLEAGAQETESPSRSLNIGWKAIALGTEEVLDSNSKYGAIMSIYSAPDYGWCGRSGTDISVCSNLDKMQRYIRKNLRKRGFDNKLICMGEVVAEGSL